MLQLWTAVCVVYSVPDVKNRSLYYVYIAYKESINIAFCLPILIYLNSVIG